MPQEVLKPGEFRVSELSTRHPTRVLLQPDAEARADLAGLMGLSALKKLRFEGEIAPAGAQGWTLRASLGATVVQPCVVTLDPVTTRIDERVERLYVPEDLFEDHEAGSETEMPEDVSVEFLGTVISAHDAMVESLSLALPQYPRAPQAALGEAVFSEDGIAPMTDEDAKPFAGLAGLRDKLNNKD